MQLKFDANQEYQLDAIASVVGLFAGQARAEADAPAWADGPIPAVPNRLDLSEEELLSNLRAAQASRGLAPAGGLECLAGVAETAGGPMDVRFPNFTIEMETGTGKTYVYLRTMLELYRHYGLRKFIIVVPSVAIREGVLKSLQITTEHLRALYNNPTYRYYVYDSDNLSQIRQFALSSGVEIMVMTLASFNKAANVVRQSSDRLQGETPVHLIQAARPILILDEPQNMESEKSIQALALLRPLFALRYSATHRNLYNLVYRLTPFDAYRQGLVKRIEVAGLVEADSDNAPFVRVDKISTQKNTVTATLSIHRLMKDGTVKEQAISVRPGENLETKANQAEYAAFTVAEINPGWNLVRFSTGLELSPGQAAGANQEAVWESQIRYTIEEHFIKQRRLRPAGIKVLSLFFIDRVDNYAPEDGVLRRLFERGFNTVKARHAEWADVEPAAVQAAYFAQRRNKEGQIFYEDSKSGESEKDRQAYDLIMKDKERLLSFEEPTAFIFSHSALREGWDNPNVFQICTLHQTVSETRKRQEIGRGVRLAVNQAGERLRDERINVLTVVANESYERYVARLQTEYAEDYAEREQPPAPANARRRAAAHLNKARLLTPEFKELWERIKPKTRYSVRIDSERLIADVVAELARTTIAPPRVALTKVQLQATEGNGFQAVVTATGKAAERADQIPLPNLVAIIEDTMERTAPPTRISRRTLLEILRRAQHAGMLANPHEFAHVAARIIKDKLSRQLVDGIRYEKISAWYEMTQFDADIESWEEYLAPAEHSLYDPVIVDSEIERQFVEDLERRASVKLYIKLPGWFVVPTPIGDYNPDWAIVIEERDAHGSPTGENLYLVRETKSSTDPGDLRPDEAGKIHCGERHFCDALGVDYAVIKSAGELPG